MANPMRFRISMASIMMLVVVAATASALFAKIVEIISSEFAEWKYDIAAVFVLAIALTAIALGALRSHSGVQMMIQATAVYLSFLSIIWIVEREHYRIAIYWFQVLFAGTVAFPLLALRFAKADAEGETGQGWPRRLFESLPLAFGNLILVFLGVWFQWIGFMYGASIVQMQKDVAAETATPIAAQDPDPGPSEVGEMP